MASSGERSPGTILSSHSANQRHKTKKAFGAKDIYIYIVDDFLMTTDVPMDSCTCYFAFASSTPFSFICASVILETVLRMCAGINFCVVAVPSSPSLAAATTMLSPRSFGRRDASFVVRGLWEWRLWTFPTTHRGFAFDRETTAALVVDNTKPAEEDMMCCISKRVLPEEGTFQTRRRKALDDRRLQSGGSKCKVKPMRRQFVIQIKGPFSLVLQFHREELAFVTVEEEEEEEEDEEEEDVDDEEFFLFISLVLVVLRER